MRVTLLAVVFAALVLVATAVPLADNKHTGSSHRSRQTHKAREDDDDDKKPLYVLPMVPLEWRLGNLITNPFQNAIDPRALENGWTPGMAQSAAGLAPNPIPQMDQRGIPVQPSFVESEGTLVSTFAVDSCQNCEFN